MTAFIKALSIGLIVASLTACSSITIRLDGGMKNTSKATYTKREPYYMFGLVGNNKVNLNEACPAGNVSQMQSVQSFTDGLLTFVTFGIYAPHTARVWCGE